MTRMSHRTALLHVAACESCMRQLVTCLLELADERDINDQVDTSVSHAARSGPPARHRRQEASPP